METPKYESRVIESEKLEILFLGIPPIFLVVVLRCGQQWSGEDSLGNHSLG